MSVIKDALLRLNDSIALLDVAVAEMETKPATAVAGQADMFSQSPAPSQNNEEIRKRLDSAIETVQTLLKEAS